MADRASGAPTDESAQYGEPCDVAQARRPTLARWISTMLHAYLRRYSAAIEGLPRETWLLAAVTLTHRAGTMVVPFLSLYLAKQLGIAVDAVGGLLAVYGAGVVLGSLLGGSISDRAGPIRVQAVSLAMTGIGFWILAGITSEAGLWIALPCVGVVAGCFRPASAAALARSCRPELRAQAFALFRLAINIGMGIGPAVGGLLAESDFGLLFLVDGSACVLAALLLVRLTRGWTLGPPASMPATSAPAASAAIRLERSPWRDGLFLFVAANTMITALIGYQWLYVGPVFLSESYALSEWQIGLVFALNPLIIVASEMVIVHTVRARPPLPWIASSGVLLALSCAILPLGGSLAWAFLVVSIWTVAEMLESPLSSAFTATRAGDRHLGRYMGVYMGAYSVSQMLAPLCGLWAYEHLGGDVLWFGSAALALGAAGLVALLAWRLSRRSPIVRPEP